MSEHTCSATYRGDFPWNLTELLLSLWGDLTISFNPILKFHEKGDFYLVVLGDPLKCFFSSPHARPLASTESTERAVLYSQLGNPHAGLPPCTRFCRKEQVEAWAGFTAKFQEGTLLLANNHVNNFVSYCLLFCLDRCNIQKLRQKCHN